jgi:hypothetical protein
MTVSALRDQLSQLVAEAPPTELPSVLGALEAARATAWARLTLPAKPSTPEPPERWLTPQEAAEICRSTKRQVYEWAMGKRWARRPSRRKLLIDEAGFRAWLASRTW